MLEKYHLRFLIVHDRYDIVKWPRTLEDVKARYYSITKKLLEVRGEPNHPLCTFDYDPTYEKYRKFQLEKYILRGKEKAEEERKLQDLLKKVDALIKKKEREQTNLKKMLEIGKEKNEAEKIEDVVEKIENEQHSIFQKSEKCVYLRGFVMHGPLPTLSSKLNKKIEAVLKELSIPERPMPTATIHSVYDTLRKEILKMFSLQIHLKNKEEEKKRITEQLERIKQDESKNEEEVLNKRKKASFSVISATGVGHRGGGDGSGMNSVMKKLKR